MLGVDEKIRQWFMSLEPVDVGNGNEVALGVLIQQVYEHVRHFAEELYCEYEPTRGPYPDFWQRLSGWLRNRDEEREQQNLFRLLSHIFFLGPREFESLYRTAFNHQIATWLIDELDIVLDDANAKARLTEAVRGTWFCPITDSMRINAFYHLNRIEGRDYRPDWRSLARFGSDERIAEYIEANNIKKLVLLEDFVGNGSQIRKGVEFAAKIVPSIPVLVVPLIVCPAADTLISRLENQYSNLKFATCLRLPDTDFIQLEPRSGEPPLFAAIRKLAEDVADNMRQGLGKEELEEANKFIPFGWHGTGALIVLHTNCPNNTLPVIFHKSEKWAPLFPRSARV